MQQYCLWHQFALGDSGAQAASHSDRENTVGQKPAGLEGLLKGLRSWAASHCFTNVWSSVAGSFGICLGSQLLHSEVFKTGWCKTVAQNLWYLRKLVCFFWKVLEVEAYWWWMKKLKWIIGWYFFPLIFFQGYSGLVVCRGHFNELILSHSMGKQVKL